MSESHTPTPWSLGEDKFGPANIGATLSGGRRIHIVTISGSMKNPEIKADAAFIVLAVNSHEALVEALRETLAVAERSETGGFADRARTALALAGEAQ